MGSAPMEDDLIVELSSMSSALWVPEGSLTDMKAFLIERLPHWMANVTSFTDAKEYILQNLIIIRDQACEGCTTHGRDTSAACGLLDMCTRSQQRGGW